MNLITVIQTYNIMQSPSLLRPWYPPVFLTLACSLYPHSSAVATQASWLFQTGSSLAQGLCTYSVLCLGSLHTPTSSPPCSDIILLGGGLFLMLYKQPCHQCTSTQFTGQSLFPDSAVFFSSQLSPLIFIFVQFFYLSFSSHQLYERRHFALHPWVKIVPCSTVGA